MTMKAAAANLLLEAILCAMLALWAIPFGIMLGVAYVLHWLAFDDEEKGTRP